MLWGVFVEVFAAGVELLVCLAVNRVGVQERISNVHARIATALVRRRTWRLRVERPLVVVDRDKGRR